MTVYNLRSAPEYVSGGYCVGTGEVLGPVPCLQKWGGACLGSGCAHWLPVPSDMFGQEGRCLLERGGEPIHRAEALRKARQYDRCAASPNHPVTHVCDLVRASRWRKLAETAPTRVPLPHPGDSK